ncbi:hypothetical protein M408DRAFT_182281 [Serendipita vermifera MAFF 305830]|uniref:Uncharacterized protein n=1 Tax=Serendipita vermifera MAFF 305830 TaxID=933852 RepID=A0A0C2XBX1_SERVB|nr:hypothetical protein M408DRAFT_182281 [Serendipita vermifera MAFF 305830]
MACYPNSTHSCPHVWSGCSDYGKYDCPALESDPDIAGLGVIISFTASAALALLSSLTCLLMQYHNRLDDAHNYIDNFIISKILAGYSERIHTDSEF